MREKFGPEDQELSPDKFELKLTELQQALSKVVLGYSEELKKVSEKYKDLQEKYSFHAALAENFTESLRALWKGVKEAEANLIRSGKLQHERHIISDDVLRNALPRPEGSDWVNTVGILEHMATDLKAEIQMVRGNSELFTNEERQNIIQQILESIGKLNNDLEQIRRVIKKEEQE